MQSSFDIKQIYMLPGFVNLKKKLLENIIIPVFDEARLTDPFLSRVKSGTQHEGLERRYQTVEGQTKDQPYEQFHAEFTIAVEDVVDKDFGYIIEKFRLLGVDAVSQMAQYSFKMINKVIDETGNKIDAKGRKISTDLILESLNKVLVDFDDDTGMALLPTFYIHPNQADAYKKV